MKRALLFALVFTLLLPELLFSFNRSLNDCCGKQLDLGNLGLAYATSYVNVNVSEAKQMIESTPDLLILDVRSQTEYDGGHIQNATLIPLDQLASRLGELDKNKEILVYCAAGGRSATASQILIDNGFSKVYNMLGGISAWKSAGYWIEIIHNGDLIIDGTQTFVIENCTYIQTGNIHVRDWSNLIVSNAVLKVSAEYEGQFGLFVENYANLDLKNVNISDIGFPVHNFDYAKTRINNSNMLLNWMSCTADSVVDIENSKVGEIIIDQRSRVTFKNGELNSVLLQVSSDSPVSLGNMEAGLFAFWNLHESEPLCNLGYNLTLINTVVAGWSVYVDSQSTVAISNSTMGIGISFSHTTAQVRDLRPAFHRMWSHNRITLDNCLLTFCELLFYEASCTVINSTFGYFAWGDANVSVIESSVGYAGYNGGLGTLYSDTSTFGWFSFAESAFFIRGDMEFSSRNIRRWASSNITRTYNILAKEPRGDPLENVGLTLFDKNDALVWNGTTDSLGIADFNLTFTDSNYTDTLRLEAVKGNLSATASISFLSDTPVTLTLGAHDVALTIVALCKNVVGQGFALPVNITVMNRGDFTENFNVTVDANETALGTQSVSNLSSGASTTLTFNWNTNGLAYGNYTFSGHVWPVQGETDLANNNYTSECVVVTVSGDIQGDFTVDIYDALLLSGAYNSRPSSPNWSPNADINGDNIVDIYDAIILAGNYGKAT